MSDSAPESEFTLIRYHHVDGAVPPPGHSELEIDLSRQGGVLRYWPDYPGETTPCWVTHFEISGPGWIRLLNELNQFESVAWRNNDPPLLGSATEWLDVHAGDLHWQIPADLCPEQIHLPAEPYRLIRDLIPEVVWLEMSSRRLEYQKQSGY